MDPFIYAVLVLAAIVFFLIVIFRTYRKHQLAGLKKKLDEKREEILSAATAFRSILNSEYYISKSEYSDWYASWFHLRPIVEEIKKKNLKAIYNEDLQELASFFENGRFLIKKKNEIFIQEELDRYHNFFDSIETHPLTENQRRAIITEEKHSLIVAGAGAGKTSTLIGKAGYLLRKQFAKPNEILLVSFARKVRNEVAERVLTRLGQKLGIRTFHSLGLNIIADVENKKPSISRLATDPLKLPNIIIDFIQTRQEDKEFLKKLNGYFAFYKTPYRSEFSFNSKGEYIDFLRNNQVRSLNGELVKSLEECEIANFLCINGIDYVYESNYEVEVATKKYRQYRPDFFLPTYNTYIEHFGVDRKNRTAPFIDREKYLQGMNWKRRIHKENGTTLIETHM